MHHDGSAATAMLGLTGFVLLAVSDHDGELEYAVETSEWMTGCPDCGVLARLHDRRRTDVRDLPAGGRPVTLVWIKRVWRCMEPDCPRQTWTETSEHIRPRASLTERAPAGGLSAGRAGRGDRRSGRRAVWMWLAGDHERGQGVRLTAR